MNRSIIIPQVNKFHVYIDALSDRFKVWDRDELYTFLKTSIPERAIIIDDLVWKQNSVEIDWDTREFQVLEKDISALEAEQRKSALDLSNPQKQKGGIGDNSIIARHQRKVNSDWERITRSTPPK